MIFKPDATAVVGAGRRPKGVIGLGWACLESTVSGRTEHRPVTIDYPESLVRRTSFLAGGKLGWRLSALTTPRESPTPWKIVVITGSPSWAEYWAPVMAALPRDREMIVVDRPGFAGSEPHVCVPDIRIQAAALAPVLRRARGQRLLLVGQSYGAAISALMAEARPDQVDGLVLLSSYLGESGPTARRLVDVGTRFLGVIPRDLRHAVIEVSGQAPQLVLMQRAVERLSPPIHVIHGEQDDFAPLETARRFASGARSRRPIRFAAVPMAGHFLNDGPVDTLLNVLESCMPPQTALKPWRFPRISGWVIPATA